MHLKQYIFISSKNVQHKSKYFISNFYLFERFAIFSLYEMHAGSVAKMEFYYFCHYDCQIWSVSVEYWEW